MRLDLRDVFSDHISSMMKVVWVGVVLVAVTGLVGGGYWWLGSTGNLLCRGAVGRPALTGVVNVEGWNFGQNWKSVDTRACLVSLGDDAIKIGYFDKSGLLRVFDTQMGGRLQDGNEVKVSFCVTKSELRTKECNALPAFEINSKLKGYVGKVIEVELVYEYTGSEWPEMAKYFEENSDIFLKFVSFLRGEKRFPPKYPEGVELRVLGVGI